MAVTPDQVATTLGVSCPDPIPYAQWDMWISDATLLITNWATRNGYTFAGLDSATVDYVIREAVALKVSGPTRQPRWTSRSTMGACLGGTSRPLGRSRSSQSGGTC